MRYTLFIIIEALLAICAYAQTDSLRMHSTLYGFGLANVLDSYLSPYSYKGIEARIIRQTERRTRMWGGHISYHTQIDGNASYTKNPAKNVKEYAGGIRYSNAWLYNFDGMGHWHLAAGLAASGYAGVIYNDRNGNNPAQGKLDVMVDLAGQASYRFRVGRRHWLARYSLAIPFMGVAFSPQYGQSYYEVFSLKNYDHNCVFANFVNMPSMRHLLSLDIPVGHNHLRLGYAAELMQTKFNGIRYHSYSHNFMIGFTKYFIRL
ncbi:MAG: DUF3316 domain-containing protein [Bacteroidaceae bacterium]|nr:DUF3316 domain-containing protein [Bacteroidaceae bacterium]